MSFFPLADAATAAVSPLSRRRNNHHRHRRTRKDDYDPYLGLGWGRQIGVDQSLSVKSKSPSRSPSSPIEFNHENIDWFNGLTSQPSPPPEKVDASSSPSHSMPLSMTSQSISMSMSSPSRSMPISTPTYMPNDAGLVKEPPEDSSTDEVSGGLQIGLIVAVVFIVAMCIAFLIIRRRNVVKQQQNHRFNEQESDSDDDSKENDEASAKERDPEGGSKSDELKQESKSADSKKIGVFSVDTSWIPSSDSSGSNTKEPIFVPAISSDEETDYKSTNEYHPEEKEEHEDEDEEKVDLSDEIQPIVRRISQLDATAEPDESKGSDHADQTEEPALDIEEVTRVERALLDEILTGTRNRPDRAMKTPDNSPDRSIEVASRANNDKAEIWREEFRRDILSGLAKMTSIHQQMLDQQAMLQAPAEIRNEYYSVISRTAIQRAELESRKIELETKRAELELKTLDLELRKVEIEEKNLAKKVSSSEESDIDQRDKNDDDVDISISEIKEG